MSYDNSEKIMSLLHHGALKPQHIEHIMRHGEDEDSEYHDAAGQILSHLRTNYNPEHVNAVLRSGNEQAAIDVAHNKNIPYEMVKHFAEPDHGNTDARHALLYRSDTPHEDFNKIANHVMDHEDSKTAVTQLYNDTRYHPDTVEKIIHHPDTWWKSKINFLNSNPKVKPETLTHFAEHGDSDEQAAVAGNHRTPKEVLHKLSTHPDSSVRWEVANNVGTHPSTLSSMDHFDRGIANSLLGNHSTPKEKVAAMVDHPIEGIAERAKFRLEKMK